MNAMNFKKILDDINNTEADFYVKESPRRSILKNFGAKVALATLPIALSSVFNKSYGQTKDTLIEILNRLLKLEYVQVQFYNEALNANGLINADTRSAFERISEDNKSHLNLLIDAITELGGTPVAQPSADLTGGGGNGNGPYKNALALNPDFLILAQVLADTAVRAYKGAMERMIISKPALNRLIGIHAVEAKHAAYVRNLRGIPAWSAMSNNLTPVAQAQKTYDDENEKVQNGVNLVDIHGFNLTENAITEAFDEPLQDANIDGILLYFGIL